MDLTGKVVACPVPAHIHHQLLAILLILMATGPAAAWVKLDLAQDPDFLQPRGAAVIDGSYVMNAGNLHINITNIGIIGSYPGEGLPMSDAPSAQWPAGTSDEYLYVAGLWVGGELLGERLVSTGVFPWGEIRAQPNPEDTIYEAIDTRLVRPPGNDLASGRRFPDPNPNDDEDLDEFGNPRIDEETLNGYDDDGDGLIDEDFAQIGNQMMVTTMYDNTRLAQENNPDHTPLNIKIVQESYAWEADLVNDFVGFDYTITNVGVTDIENIYIGMFADGDIMNRSNPAGYTDDMVGSFKGAVRASDGTFVPVEIGYMYDSPEEGEKLDGYFGVAFLGHATDPAGVRAPRTMGLHTFRHFSGQTPFDQGGLPTNDQERYLVLSSGDRDNDPAPGKEDDYRFVVAAGPFQRLRPDEELTFQVAFVVGSGLEGMLRNAAEAMLTFYGGYFDLIGNYASLDPAAPPVETGVNGRETMICQEDYAGDLDQLYPDVGDLTCISFDFLQSTFAQVTDADKFRIPDPRNPGATKTCVMVNMDNCFECFRQKTFPSDIYPFAPDEIPCEPWELEEYWNCYKEGTDDSEKRGCTGIGGAETQVRWLVGMAPPPPGLRLWPTERQTHIFWDNLSEITPDVRLDAIDFQSYRIWRADNWTRPFGSSIDNGPGSNLWQLIAEYDVIDSFVVDYFNNAVPPQVIGRDTLPLGRNTGLEDIRYTPVSLGDPRFDGLAEAMQQVIDSDPDGLYQDRPPLYDRQGVPLEIMQPLLPWQSYPAVLDTFWAVTAREETTYVDPDTGETVEISGKDAAWYYEYIDPYVHNGFLYFYSVTATDHDLELIPGSNPPQFINRGAGLSGHPSSSFDHSTPGTFAQTATERERQGINIYVYPNPATRGALGEFQQLSPDPDDPTGVRVRFANLPAARNTIKIFTLAGDLVQTLEHDGTGGFGEVGWNLISRNQQEIVSGIYLYVVQSSDSRFEDFIGKFVVVR